MGLKLDMHACPNQQGDTYIFIYIILEFVYVCTYILVRTTSKDTHILHRKQICSLVKDFGPL